MIVDAHVRIQQLPHIEPVGPTAQRAYGVTAHSLRWRPPKPR